MYIKTYDMKGVERMNENMPTDIQFKYELRKHLTEIERKLELLQSQEYDKLEKEYLKEIDDIKTSLQD